MWTRVIEILEENLSKVKTGFELSEVLRQELKGEEIRVPVKLPVSYIVPIIKKELRSASYHDLARKYSLSEQTIRNYDMWKVQGNKLISPDGREYPREDPA